jgi:hypothetical protein
MMKAGLIGAAIGFVLALGGALVFSLLCNPCAAVFIGLGAGILAGVYATPSSSGGAAGEGAKAGAIASVGNLLGQMVGTVVTVLIVPPEVATQMAVELGREWGVVIEDPAVYESLYRPIQLGGGCLCGLFGVLLGAGLGAVGGLLWHQIRKQGQELDRAVEGEA